MEKNELAKRLALGRNEKCHCGSGKKYKHCHMPADETAMQAIRQKEEAAKAAEAAADAGKEEKTAETHDKHTYKRQDYVVKNRPTAPAHAGASQVSLPRKSGGG
ncbi:MAG: SEC-C domain-containing protein [Spirochaetes bacterium]|nr:SEC-C domain-containing protein [Spirochaetota bacterium]